VTTTADSGAGSLRNAITAADNNGGSDTIIFNVAGTINLTSSLPSLTDDVTIIGPGANLLTVRRDPAAASEFRIFEIANGKTVAISGLTISDGLFTSGLGGGIRNSGTLTISSSTISNNSASFGGGIYSVGNLTVGNSTISGNSATGNEGGGIDSAGGALTMSNSTVSGNTSRAAGGGIGANITTITNTTVCNNVSSFGRGGGIAHGSGALNLNNSIVANNSDAVGFPDVDGAVSSGDYNLIRNTSGTTLPAGSTHNITGQDPKLGPLSNNGGPTKTHALLPGSPALDAGSNGLAAGLTTDQRGFGFPRVAPISGGTVDIGALEGAIRVVTKTADTNDGTCDADCSLREAIATANPGDTVLFSSLFNTPQTITLGSGVLNVTKDLKILGTGANNLTVSGNNASRVFFFGSPDSRRFTLYGMTITSGNALDGGAIFIQAMPDQLIMMNSVVSGNSAGRFGGGIFNSET